MELKVIRQLGRGGFGVVEEVVDGSGNRFARKTFSPSPNNALDTATIDKLRKRFMREVRIQKELGGLEIIPILHDELVGDNPWFLMPLADKTYETQIKEDQHAGKVNVEALADIINGLVFLHSRDYTHRDLNPRNILLHDGHWKLSDFGAALPPTGQTVTMTEDTIIFTEQYCSPEQRRDFHSARPPADIYSFGCILHDLFGTPPRNPYGQHNASGSIGVIIERCTHSNPAKRPSIDVLQSLVLDELLTMGGECRVSDAKSEEWLEKLVTFDAWEEDTYEDFARFFCDLNTRERVPGHETEWVDARTTPFLTHLPATILEWVAKRSDGTAQAIIEKYCEWAQSTRFLFSFSDSVCVRLATIADNGNPSMRTLALIALFRLGASHHRWFIMREALRRCQREVLDPDLAKRLEIEIKVDGVEHAVLACASGVNWDVGGLAPEIAAFIAGDR